MSYEVGTYFRNVNGEFVRSVREGLPREEPTTLRIVGSKVVFVKGAEASPFPLRVRVG